ncbi:FtsX-like permease family protein [Segetibacter sp. 3557_3]|uniref:ABC transporter permease n=1 Tax=Segetibacter sp. 3557_3 TaxID=2547429 RepID=UPI001058E600|nr:ABC transporter permease [Segetibacter sp. 3557_3]TDH24204.1 FtsX-like permease family protein [Segetibacter sp. 3557_3]
MITHYFKIAIRNFRRNKLFSFINVFGLGLSMSVCLLVLLRLNHQLSYDGFHSRAKELYRINTVLTSRDGSTYRMASSAMPLAPALLQSYGIIDKAIRVQPATATTASTSQKALHIRAAYTDPGFLQVFSFPVLKGDAATALKNPNTVVLSRTYAERLFGSTNVIGSVLTLENAGNFIVTAVLAEAPSKSHLDFDAYFPIASITGAENEARAKAGDWSNYNHTYTYVLLHPGATEDQLQKAAASISAELAKTSSLQGQENYGFMVQPFGSIVLGEELINNLGDIGSRSKTFIEILVGLVILVSACFNYTNLSIARSLKRGKEVGIRKVSGAPRTQVFYQFITESLLVSLVALAVGCFMLKLIIDYAPFSGEMIPEGFSINRTLVITFIVFACFTGLIAGVIPAWALSSFAPVDVLKNLANVKLFGGNRFRKGLIITQFTISLFTLIFTTIAARQFRYMSSADPGFDRENLAVIPLNGADPKVIATRLKTVTGVEDVSATSLTPGHSSSGRVAVSRLKGNQPLSFDYYDTDLNWLKVLRLQLTAGNSMPEVNDAHAGAFVVINEKAIEVLNFKSASEAVGQTVWLNDSSQVQIAGVVKDFHFRSLAVPISPLVLRYRPDNFKLLQVRTNLSSPQIETTLESAWKQVYPAKPFQVSWLQQDLYERASALSTVSMLYFLAFIAVTIACLGLFAMVIYNTETRTKEIGIRKVFGASVAVIVTLLSRDFLKLVFIAGLIALPLSLIGGGLFLQVFASRVTMDPVSIILCFAGLLVLVMLTISTQIIKVASANPVASLKVE